MFKCKIILTLKFPRFVKEQGSCNLNRAGSPSAQSGRGIFLYG